MKNWSRLLLALVLCSTGAWAQGTFQSKEWGASMEEGSDYYWAATTNASGHLLGQYCYFSDGSCVYMMAMKTTCEAGSQSPAIINSDAGSVAATVMCSHTVEDQNVMFIYPFDDVDRVVRQATHIGIAIPMADGQFRVSRFGLAGSTYAIDRMRDAAQVRMQKQPTKRALPSEENL